MRIRLLGEVGAVTDQGEPADVGPAKCQAVLAALALAAGTAVPEWRLVDLVWGQDPPRTAGRTLQSYVVRLRKGLGHDSIVRVGAAYRLDVTADSVDALRFQQRMDAGDIEVALAEWTGLPLAGLVVPGLAATVDGLVERWLVAVETDLERRVLRRPGGCSSVCLSSSARSAWPPRKPSPRTRPCPPPTSVTCSATWWSGRCWSSSRARPSGCSRPCASSRPGAWPSPATPARWPDVTPAGA